MAMNPLYQLYLQQGNQQPLSKLSINNQQAAADQSGDTNFQDLWNYLKWARKAYDLYAKVSGNPTTGNYINQAWDYGKDLLSGTPEAGANVGAEAGSELGSMGYEASPYYTGTAAATADAGSELGSMAYEASPYYTGATVATPLIMAYMKYQAGSGRNEPLEKTIDTRKTARLLTDILNEKNIDWNSAESQYGIKPKELSGEVSGVDPENPNQMLDPGGWTAKDLYDRMLQESSQYYQTGGVGSSLYSGNQINEMFGPDKQKLADAMGLPSLPDWSNFDKGSGWNPNYLSNDPTGQAIKAQQGFNPYDEQWNALDEQTKNSYTHSNDPEWFGTDAGRRLWENEQMVKALNDKYKMSLKPLSVRKAERSQGW
jgi:hypothetical protein